MQTETFLLIVLSLALVVFIVMGAVLLYFLIKMAAKANRMGDKAEAIANDLAATTKSLRQNLKPKVVAAAVSKGIKKMTSNKGRKSGKR